MLSRSASLPDLSAAEIAAARASRGNYQNPAIVLMLILLTCCSSTDAQVALPTEQPLWNHTNSTIAYADGERVRNPPASESAPSGSNRVFTDVGTATYSIHRPDPSKSNGIGLVICPGGGYRDVWLDREGHDLGLWLKDHGVTSLVLKYRTNGGSANDQRAYAWDEYMKEVIADARQAVRVLRSKAEELHLDNDKIGVCGFSAGGNLAMHAAFSNQDDPAEANVNFAGLFYPWLREADYGSLITKQQGKIPPLFIMNASDDRVTPADRCIEFYAKLLAADVRTELHIVSKGGHGFDLGDGRGESAALWKHSFVAWLKDVVLAE